MSRKSQFEIFLPIIEKYFESLDTKSFSEKTLQEIYYNNSVIWETPSTKSASDFISFLQKKGALSVTLFTDESNNQKNIYSWKTKDDFTVMSGLKREAYYSHYSALFLHQLTLQIPKTFYLNFEHSSDMDSARGKSSLTQSSIDKAFSGSQRKTALAYSYNDVKIFILNGKKTGKLGVIKQKNNVQCYEYTDIERTLIDIAVRPVYSGGVFEVLEAYKKAKGKINSKRLADYLKALNFIYPYHQVIGFYLEKAGYSEADLKLFETEINFRFYLTYDIRNKSFSDRWQLYFPKGV